MNIWQREVFDIMARSPCTVQKMSEATGVDRRGIYRVLNDLKTMGLVASKFVQNDYDYELTEEGSRLRLTLEVMES